MKTPTALHDIKGIGPGYERRLIGAGIDTIEALALADADSLASSPHSLPRARIVDWINEARSLLPPEAPSVRSPQPEQGVESDVFVIRVSRDPTHPTGRVSIHNVRTSTGRRWNSWVPEELQEFMERESGLLEGTAEDEAALAGAAHPARLHADVAQPAHEAVPMELGHMMMNRPRDVEVLLSTNSLEGACTNATVDVRLLARKVGSTTTTVAGSRTYGMTPPDPVIARFDDLALPAGLYRLSLDLSVRSQTGAVLDSRLVVASSR